MTERFDREYDAIVVGARPAGAATAMLLARAGWRVLVIDRSSYGADTLSTHALMRGGVVQLQRWGLLDAVHDAGTPPIRRTRFHYGDDIVDVEIREQHGTDALYAPRRTVLDALLVDAARDAGAHVRYGISVHGVERDAAGRVMGVRAHDRDGCMFVPHAGIVIGADGMRSTIARAVDAPVERETRASAANMYAYFEGIEPGAYDWHFGSGVTAGVIPTNGGLANVFVAMPTERFTCEVHDKGVEALFESVTREVGGALTAQLATARRVGNFRSFPGHPGVLRRAYGPGWALVGDAGYFKDPCVAHGITDALIDAELLARSLIEIGGASAYEAIRDAKAHPMLTIATATAAHNWSRAEIMALHQQLKVALAAEVELMSELDVAATSAA